MSTDFDDAIRAWAENLTPTVVNAYYERIIGNPSLITVLRREMTRDYAGEGLDAQLAEFGQRRLPGESDFDFRKRTFPAVFAQNQEEAIRIFLTCPHTLVTDLHGSLLADLAQDTSPSGLSHWISGWGTDPYRTYHTSHP